MTRRAHPMIDLKPGHAQVMRELRANGWSLEGIASIYGTTIYAVRLMIHEETSDD